MLVLILTNSLKENNGWSIVSKNLIKNLNFYKPYYFSYDQNVIIPEKLRSTRQDFFITLIHIIDLLIIIFRFNNKPDIIHCNCETFAVLAWFLSKLYNRPYTITAHGTYSILFPKSSFLYKQAFRNASRVLSVSKYTKKQILDSNIRCNVKVINPGVNKDIYSTNLKILKQNNIVFVGSEKKRKGLFYLLKACLDISPNLINELLLIVKFIPNDQLNNYLINLLKKKGIKVKIMKGISTGQLVKKYQKAKINILPSQNENGHFEGFGLIHLEANACGTLSIGCLDSGNEDAIKNGYGFLIPQKNHKELASKIKEILNLEPYPILETKDIRTWQNFAEDYEQVWIKIS